MALYTLENSPLTIKYLVTLFNSYFIFWYKRSFINSTAAFQINDARLIPIVIPSLRQVEELEKIFDMAVSYKRDLDFGIIPKDDADKLFAEQQLEIDQLILHLYQIH